MLEIQLSISHKEAEVSLGPAEAWDREGKEDDRRSKAAGL